MRQMYYCETSAAHAHLSRWEADNCSELYELWQAALGQFMDYVREDEVELAVNLALMDKPPDEEKQRP